jgi:hypothetical protein
MVRVCYNDYVHPASRKTEEFFIAASSLKGAVCRCGYSSEQAGWMNQTVPLSL